MEWVDGDFILKDIDDFKWVKNELFKRVPEFRDFPEYYIKRCVGIFLGIDLQGFFITCELGGIRSFHGYKFIKDKLLDQMRMARRYIDMENLEFSSYKTKQAGAVLKCLGFIDIDTVDGFHIARRKI